MNVLINYDQSLSTALIDHYYDYLYYAVYTRAEVLALSIIGWSGRDVQMHSTRDG